MHSCRCKIDSLIFNFLRFFFRSFFSWLEVTLWCGKKHHITIFKMYSEEKIPIIDFLEIFFSLHCICMFECVMCLSYCENYEGNWTFYWAIFQLIWIWGVLNWFGLVNLGILENSGMILIENYSLDDFCDTIFPCDNCQKSLITF